MLYLPYPGFTVPRIDGFSLGQYNTLVKIDPAQAGPAGVEALALALELPAKVMAEVYNKWQEYGESRSRTASDWLGHMLNDLGLKLSFREIGELYTAMVHAWISRAELYPGGVGMLGELRDLNIPTAVCSNCTWVGVAVANQLGLRKRVDFMGHSCVLHMRKPNANIYQRVAEALGIEPRWMAHVDDDFECVRQPVEELDLIGILLLHEDGRAVRQMSRADIMAAARDLSFIVADSVTDVLELTAT